MTTAPLLRPAELDTRAMGQPELISPPAVELMAGVRSMLNVQYAAPPGFRPLVLDLHLPAATTGRSLPVAVYGHGGGFFTGTKSMGPWRFLLEAGIAVATVDYRLSGEVRFPAPVHDVAAAVRWLRANADNVGLDAERIIGFGSSAGGYLVSAVALAEGHPELVGGLGPHPDTSCHLSAVVDHYAPTDFLRLDEDAPEDVVEVSDAPGSSADEFFGFVPSTRPEDAEVATLSQYATADSPPFLILHGDTDHRVGHGQSRRLHDALTEAGARSELILVPGGDHGSPEFDAPPVHEQTLTFLRSVLQLDTAN